MPVKDRLTQDGFKTFDLKTRRRLRSMDASCTLRNATCLSYGDEGSQKIAIQIVHLFCQ